MKDLVQLSRREVEDLLGKTLGPNLLSKLWQYLDTIPQLNISYQIVSTSNLEVKSNKITLFKSTTYKINIYLNFKKDVNHFLCFLVTSKTKIPQISKAKTIWVVYFDFTR